MNFGSLKQFFGSLRFNAPNSSPPTKSSAEATHLAPEKMAAELYKVGDVIFGEYEIRGKLGEGGFGIVYRVWSREQKKEYALKTFKDGPLDDAEARAAFRKETCLWLNLEPHPFIVAARWVREYSGRLFVAMDYITPDALKRVSLHDHLDPRAVGGRANEAQALEWAIQFCLGMEHLQAQGVSCHRDIKPANIFITENGRLRIADFGLAAAVEAAWHSTKAKNVSLPKGPSASSLHLAPFRVAPTGWCGTPGYIAPEVYDGRPADVRSDVYSFGLVLWQIATWSVWPPFSYPLTKALQNGLDLNQPEVRYEVCKQIWQLQNEGEAPPTGSILGHVVERCLRPNPAERYNTFAELRAAIEPLFERATGKKFELPSVGKKTAYYWNLRGMSLGQLGEDLNAIECFNKALELNPRFVMAWNNKGVSLGELGKHGEEIDCYNRALELDPKCAPAWGNKGNWFSRRGEHREAIQCYDQALEREPDRVIQWCNKANSLVELGRPEAALNCCDRALEIDPRCLAAWRRKGTLLESQHKHEDAIKCFDHALKINPQDDTVWNDVGNSLVRLGRRKEAMKYFKKSLQLNPRNAVACLNIGFLLQGEEALEYYERALEIDPQFALAYNNTAMILGDLGRHKEALNYCARALEIDPKLLNAWNNKGRSLASLGKHEEAVECFEEALAIDPKHSVSWYNKAISEKDLGLNRAMKASLHRCVEVGSPNDSEIVERARLWLAKL